MSLDDLVAVLHHDVEESPRAGGLNRNEVTVMVEAVAIADSSSKAHAPLAGRCQPLGSRGVAIANRSELLQSTRLRVGLVPAQ